MRASQRATRASSAVAVYVIILVAFQVFLLTVAVAALLVAAGVEIYTRLRAQKGPPT